MSAPTFHISDISVLQTGVDCKLRCCSNLPPKVSIATFGYDVLRVHVSRMTNQETAVRVTELDNCPVLASRLQVQIGSDHVIYYASVCLRVEQLPSTLHRKMKQCHRKQQIASKKG